jgi:outer membrane receptor protein involved in Fe transport
MSQKGLTTRFLGKPRALFLALAALPGVTLYAQDSTAPAPAASSDGSTAPAGTKNDEVVQMDAFSVTGSNIARMDSEKVLPVTQLNNDSMDARNALQPIQMITALPEVDGVPANESANGGAGQRGDISTVNLRGIGSQFTLLLLDGRRLVPHPIISVTNFSPNANQYPNQGIDHIDVLRDGASSIYGTDAVAGVINYVMKRDFTGNEFKFKYAAPEHGGANETEDTLTIGRDLDSGKGHIVLTLDYLYRDALFTRERGFSASADHSSEAPAPFNVETSVYNGLGGNGVYPIFAKGSNGYTQETNGTTVYGIPNAPSGSTYYFYPVASATATPTITTAAPSRITTPWFYENLNAYQMILPRTNRENAFLMLDHDIVGTIQAFSDISFYHARSTLERQPQSLAAPGSDYYKFMSVNNPFNPFGSSFYSPTGANGELVGTPQALTISSRELIEEGPEHIEVNDGLYRAVGGLKGKIGSTWNWESAVLYTRAEATDISHETRESALATALGNTTAATAYNPFGYNFAIQNGAVVPTTPYTNPQSVVKGFMSQWAHDGFTSIGSIDAKAAGEIMTLWAGPWSAAFGGEFREEAFGDHRPPYDGLNPPNVGLDPLNNDIITASAKPNSEGKRKITSAYAETVLPLVSPKNDIMGVNSLETTGSVRFERYNDFGNTTRPKVGVNWKPFDFLMIRASFNEGFSAPSLPLVNYGEQYSVDSQPGTPDPYRTPVTGVSSYVAQNQTSTTPGGLKPSTSIGKSVGAVLDVPVKLLKGLSFTADYWQINQQNLIGTGPGSSSFIMSADQAALEAYTQQQLAAGTPIGSINAGSGLTGYHGSQYVVRYAPTASDIAEFAAYNAKVPPSQQEAAVGAVDYRINVYENLASGYSDGWDLGMNYEFPKTPWGKLAFNSEWSYQMRNYTIAPVAGLGDVITDNMNSGGITRWRGTSTLTWRFNKWEADFGAYYIGKYQDPTATTTAAVYQSLGDPSWIEKQYSGGVYAYRPLIEDTLNYNVGLSYRYDHTAPIWVRDTTFRVGVINLLDEKPPVGSGNFGFDTSVYNQLAIGREFTFDLTRHF